MTGLNWEKAFKLSRDLVHIHKEMHKKVIDPVGFCKVCDDLYIRLAGMVMRIRWLNQPPGS